MKLSRDGREHGYQRIRKVKGGKNHGRKIVVTKLWIMLSLSWVSRVSSWAGLRTLLPPLQILWAVDFSGDAHGSFSREALLRYPLALADFPYQYLSTVHKLYYRN